jgi:hypothetical protein
LQRLKLIEKNIPILVGILSLIWWIPFIYIIKYEFVKKELTCRSILFVLIIIFLAPVMFGVPLRILDRIYAFVDGRIKLNYKKYMHLDAYEIAFIEMHDLVPHEKSLGYYGTGVLSGLIGCVIFPLIINTAKAILSFDQNTFFAESRDWGLFGLFAGSMSSYMSSFGYTVENKIRDVRKTKFFITTVIIIYISIYIVNNVFGLNFI